VVQHRFRPIHQTHDVDPVEQIFKWGFFFAVLVFCYWSFRGVYLAIVQAPDLSKDPLVVKFAQLMTTPLFGRGKSKVLVATSKPRWAGDIVEIIHGKEVCVGESCPK